MRATTTTTLALGAALAAFAASPAAALDRYEDGTRISHAALERARAADATAQGVARADEATAGTATGLRPAGAAAPCPGGGGGGGVWLNGRTLNGFSLNGVSMNGASPDGAAPASAAAAGAAQQRVTTVRLPDGRALAVGASPAPGHR